VMNGRSPVRFASLPAAKCRVFGRKCRVNVGFLGRTRHPVLRTESVA
jgi:hypothetical protein